MNELAHAYSYDPNRLLDMLMQKLEVASDKSLAAKLRVSNGIIGSLRAGTPPVSASLLTWMSEISGVTIDELRAVLGDRRARFRVAVRRQTSKPREVSTVIGEKNFQEQS